MGKLDDLLAKLARENAANQSRFLRDVSEMDAGFRRRVGWGSGGREDKDAVSKKRKDGDGDVDEREPDKGETFDHERAAGGEHQPDRPFNAGGCRFG